MNLTQLTTHGLNSRWLRHIYGCELCRTTKPCTLGREFYAEIAIRAAGEPQ